MKDPAFLFYPGDYLRDTQCLSEPVQVAYDRIMCEHMRKICISHTQLKFFTKKLSAEEIEELKNVLTETINGFHIEWVVESISKRKAYSDSRRKNRSKKTTDEPAIISKTYDTHMENESEDVIVITNPSGKEGVGEKPNSNIPAYETFLKEALIATPDVDENHVRITFENWVNNGWKDANSKPIKNWKSLLLYCAPTLKKKNASPAGPIVIGRQTEETVNKNFNAFMGNG